MPASTPQLFRPCKVGALALAHRVVMAPMTRLRARADHVHDAALAAAYYAQRAGVPGTLLVSEGTLVAPQAGGLRGIPGIWSDAQVDAWKTIVDAVHAKGSYIYVQFWSLGAGADPKVLAEEGQDYVSASDVKRSDRDVAPRPLTTDEIAEYVRLYAAAASNAVHRAGFDGVEIHAAFGYLVDTFIQDATNTRADAYGGSVENRNRFPLELVDAVSAQVGEERTALRLSPWGRPDDVRTADPIAQFGALVQELAKRHPSLAYIHVLEPGVSGLVEHPVVPEGESNDFLRAIWAPRPFISSGGYTRARALEAAETKGGLVSFGRLFISNPDLPTRLRKGIPAATASRAVYYSPGAAGYTDWPAAQEVGVDVVA